MSELWNSSARSDCDFCNEFGGGTSNYFSGLYGAALRCRIILSSDNFNVVPSLGQITEGHVLIAPKAHYTAAADLPRTLVKELKRVVNSVRSAVAAAYGRSVIFEHGTRGHSPGGCGVTHLHIHIVPLAHTMDPIESIKNTYPFKTIPGFEQINDTNDRSSYLYYEDARSSVYLFETENLPSQYVRQILASSVDSREWDWRKAAREPTLLATISRLSPLLKCPEYRVSQK